jgi:two-component system, chemotaxis family, protein-glutamate methylesterase/glutaminase
MIKVLVVDDSALMRKHLCTLLENAGGFTVKSARNGVDCLAQLGEFNPDVITLDINMPEMDGITCLARIMATKPKPVVMVSSLTAQGAEATLQALSLGAVDCIEKPDGTISLSIERIEREVLAKIRNAAKAKVRGSIGLRDRIAGETGRTLQRGSPQPARQMTAPGSSRPGMVLVGVSTGGPGTLEQILTRLPAHFPSAILVAQHMPGSFTGVFARRLNDLCKLPVVEVDRQMPIEKGTVYIAKGDADLVILKRAAGYAASPVPPTKENLWRPSVGRLVTSALQVVPADQMIGVMLTGMGNDGAEAMTEMHRRGSLTIAQNEATCVVFGMPNELIKRGGASVVLASEEVAGQLVAWLGSVSGSLGGRGRAH